MSSLFRTFCANVIILKKHKFRPSQTYVESQGEATGANSGVIVNKEAEKGAAEELAGSGGCL